MKPFVKKIFTRRWAVIALTSGLVTAALSLLAGAGGLDLLDPPVRQPVSFDHKKHMETDLTCLNCHGGANKEASTGIPPVRRCIRCHEAEEIENPATEALRVFAEENGDIPWVRVYRVDAHTYFSHRRHVALAKIDCAVCHGDMAIQTRPVTRQAIPITMDGGISCHRKQGVTEDCLSCHR